MAKEKERINKELLKIDEAVKSIFDKADARIEAGQEALDADWQATLELMLLMIHRHLLDNPGRLLPAKIDGQDEWDFYRDMNLGEAVVTARGILQDNPDECRALIGRIAVEIDMNLETLDLMEGVKMPNRNKNPEYSRIFDKTAKMIYEAVTGRSCPESVEVL